MKNSDHIEGDDLYIRLLFRLADEKEKDYTDGCINKALYETNISVAQYKWSDDGIHDYTLDIHANKDKYDSALVVRFVEALAKYSDCNNADIKITSMLEFPLLQAHWTNGVLHIWELDPQFYEHTPIGERGGKFWLNLLFDHVWKGRAPLAHNCRAVTPRYKVRMDRTKELAEVVNKTLASMDCTQIETEQLENALLPFVQPTWRNK